MNKTNKNIEYIFNANEIMIFINIDKYISLMHNIEVKDMPTKDDITKHNEYHSTFLLFLMQLERFNINKSASDIFNWYISWENYINNLSNDEYRFFINSRINNYNLDQFQLNKNEKASTTDFKVYNKLIKEKHIWIKNYLNKVYDTKTHKEQEKIKEINLN